jgi:hypothetical protein
LPEESRSPQRILFKIPSEYAEEKQGIDNRCGTGNNQQTNGRDAFHRLAGRYRFPLRLYGSRFALKNRKFFLCRKPSMPQDEESSETPLLQSSAPKLLTNMKVPHRATTLKDAPRVPEKHIRDVPPNAGHRFRGSLNSLNANSPLVMRNSHPYGL